MVRDWEILRQVRELDAAENLRTDNDVLLRIATGSAPNCIRLWSSPAALVVSQKDRTLPGFDRATSVLTERGWPIVLRNSGGTACPQGFGILNVSVMFMHAGADPLSIERSYGMFCARLQAGFGKSGIKTTVGPVAGSFCDGRFNIVAGGRKLAGTAQRWKPVAAANQHIAILAHAIILVSVDKELVTEAIADFYRLAGADVSLRADALVNASELIPRQRRINDLPANLIQAFTQPD